jgi:type I restriction enzyme M protein
MLDTDTKRRIDTARDLLVGKVPDPKSQVEQITIALIYKFMDDMDAEAEELGGKRKFFSGEYGKFGWAKLMQPGIGGHELLALYADGIAKMPENPGIPALFRDIFKNAYLPYRDPETLKSFLKVINEFTYDHSERLGDAFEYLLSVLGSQGDAGQFRTPRHIIDFIVEILAPRKEESLLDPACGTAGFLISAYKHILRTNTDARAHSTLTPDEKGRLAKKFNGYDISPDMVRLSLVNLYLHGFTDPHIFEYDTLTDVARWNEYADVILANPPFMSPKGGIRPHNRFSIQAKRSEVLFVDYIAEHLTPNGRAGIIVPEGIIFQSQNAYKDLRKMLVENSLVAVISLPAGCFNPYSGVKTSILLLDKSLARQSDTVAFFKVENDGYDLGAQRRPIQKNDLPKVQEELESYLATLRERKDPSDLALSAALIVPKEKIAANGDYNLSGERYREGASSLSVFPLVNLDAVFTKIGNGVNVNQIDEIGRFRVSRIQTIADGTVNLEKTKYTDDEVKPESFLRPGDILLSHINSFDHLGKTAIFLENAKDVIHGINLLRLIPDTTRIDPRYAINVFKTTRFIDTVKSFAQKAVNQASVKTSDLREIQIPLPPLEIQKEIVAEIEGYQKVINGARAILDNYRPHIPINSEWPEMPLGEVCRFIDYRGKTPEKTESGIPLITAKNVREGFINPEPREYIAEKDYDSWMTRGIPQTGDILFTMEAPLGNVAEITMTNRFALAQRLVALCPNREIMIGSFLKDLLLTQTLQEKIFSHQSGTTVYGIKASILKEIKIPVPPLAEQQAIVAEIEAEQALVNANRELITRFEAKIQTTLSRIWGDESSVS